MSKHISLSKILDSLTKIVWKSIVYCGFTIIIYMFLLFGSSMRKFDESSIRYKIENQVLHSCEFSNTKITRYLLIKTVLSFIAGGLVFLLYGPILHLPMSLIFALIFFVLNYIPHIVPVPISYLSR